VTRYAENTQVSTDRSRAEIERTLQRYGASAFMYGWETDRALIQFKAHERLVRFVLDLPAVDDPDFTTTPTGKARAETAAYAAWEQACRQRWRALALVVKAKLEAVEAGITEFEDEFLAHIVLPGGGTAGQWLRPQIEEAYTTGRMPEALPALGTGR
jgi:hypothetical protein